MRFLTALFGLLLITESAQAASTINTAQPLQGIPYNASPVRLNFGAAANDINALQTLNAGASAPSNPSLGYLWVQTGSASKLYPLSVWDGVKWLPIGTVDAATHLWTPPVGGGAAGSLLSAATTDLGSVAASSVTVTGNNPIFSFGASAPPGTIKFVTFSGSPMLNYNATSLLLPTKANISVSAGDTVIAQALGVGSWNVLVYQPVSGFPINIFTAGQVQNTTALRNACTGAIGCPLGDFVFPNGVIRWTDGVAGAPPLPYSKDTAGICSADDGGHCVAAAGGGYWLAQFSGPADVRQWGVVGNGITDDTTAFTAAVTWCNAGGPTTAKNRAVTIGAGRVVVNTFPPITWGCTLTASPLTSSNTGNSPLSILRPSAILLGSGQTLTAQSGHVENIGVVPASLTPATSFQDALTKIAAFSGTGITVDGDNTTLINDVVIGFSQCIGSAGVNNSRVVMHDINVDCTNGVWIDNAHDVDSIFNVRGWEYFNGHTYDIDSETVSGVANNGSGAIRLLIGSTANMATGNSIVVAGVGGALGANGVWTVTVVDASHIDLQGSSFSGQVYTASLTSGQGLATALSSTAGIFPGEGVSGTGVPGSTTVLAVDSVNNYVWLSNLATVTGSESLTFSTGSYTSGGTSTLDAAHRAGIFFRATNSEENHYTDLFEYGWQTGYNPSTGTQWQEFHNVGCDGRFWVNNTCLLVDGNALHGQFIGVNTTGVTLTLVDAADSETLIRGLYSVTQTTEAVDSLKIILQNTGDTVDIDGRGNGPTQYVANYNSSGTVRFQGTWPGTFLLNSSLAPTIGTTMPTPQLVGVSGWTPNLLFGGTSGVTFASSTGIYSIDSYGLMTLSLKFALSNVGAATGVADISGFPTPCVSALRAGVPNGVGSVGYFDNMASSIGSVSLVGNSSIGDEIDLFQNATAGVTPQLTNASFTNTAKMYGTFSCYTR